MDVKIISVKAEPENLICLIGGGRDRFEAEAIDNEWRSAIEMWEAWYDSDQKGAMPITVIYKKWQAAPWWKRFLWILKSQWKWSRIRRRLRRPRPYSTKR